MAENEYVYKLTVDTSGTNTDDARRALESLKKQILETEGEIKKLQAGLKDGSKTINEAAGPLSQHEARLKALRTTYNETARAAVGLEGFTQKIGKQFREAIGPINDLVGRLGPVGNVINQVSTKLGDINKTSAQSAEGIGKLNAFTGGIARAAGGAVLAVGALAGGIAALGVGLASSVQAYDESIQAQRQLEVALGGTSRALLDQASALQKTTGFADEAIVKGQAYAASLGLTESQIKELTPAVLDLAAATGQDVTSAFESVASTLVGGRDALKKYGIELDDTKGKSEQVQQAIDGLTQKFGGQAEAIASAGAGPVRQFQITVGELEETLGSIIVRGIGPFVEGLNSLVQGFNDAIAPAQSASDAFASQVSTFVDTKIEIDGLTKKYDELKGKQTLTAEEQTTLNQTIERIGEIVPSAITGVNSYGKALDINRGKVDDFVQAEIARLKVLNKDAIEDTKKALEEQQKLSDAANKRINGGIEGFVRTAEGLFKESYSARDGDWLVPVRPEDIARLKKDAEDLGTTVLGLQAQLEQLNGDAIQKELDARIAAQEKEKNAVDAATEAYRNQTATLDQLTKTKQKFSDDLKNVPESDTGRIKAISDEIAAIDKRIAAFGKNQKAAAEDSAKSIATAQERATKISAAYDLEIAAIDSAESRKLVTQVEADTRRNQALSKFLAERIKLETDAATTAAEKNGGEIPLDFKLRINGLEEEKQKVDREVERLKLEAQAKIREISGRIDLKVSADVSALERQLSDAVAFDDLKNAFENAFADTANSVSADVKQALLAAAQDGTIDFGGLIKNGAVPEQIVKDLQAAYQTFYLQTERNRITLVRDQEQEKLNQLKKRYEELIRIIAELDEKKADPTVTLTAEEEESYTNAKKELDSLDGDIREVTLKVNADTNALDKIGEAITNATGGDGSGNGDEVGGSFWAKLFGISDEKAELYVNGAIDLTNSIGDAVFEAQQAQIQRRLDLTNQAIADERDVTLRGIEDRVNAGLITEQEANRLREKANKEAEEKRRKAAKEAVEADRRIKSSQATIAFFSELAQLGLSSRTLPPGTSEIYYGIQAAISAARYAGNLAAINSTPVAEKGTIVKAQDGMMAQGPSHADGGILGVVSGKPAVELEGGEAIINKRSSEVFAPLLSMINAHNGWGVPLMASGGKITRGTALVNATYTDEDLDVLFSQRMYRFGGMIPRFNYGGMIPAEGTIANRRQLEIATANSRERVVKLNGDKRSSRYTVHVDDLTRKMDGIKDAENNVTFGI